MFVVDSVTMDKAHTDQFQSMQFCKAEGARLNNHVIGSFSASGLSECIQLCVSDINCQSLNYQKSNNTCELNDVALEFDEGLSSDFTHLTRRIPC